MHDSTNRMTVELRARIPTDLLVRLDMYAAYEQRDRSNSVRVLIDTALRMADDHRGAPLSAEVAKPRAGPAARIAARRSRGAR